MSYRDIPSNIIIQMACKPMGTANNVLDYYLNFGFVPNSYFEENKVSVV